MADPFTPEFQLAAACCRFPHDQASSAAVAAAVTRIVSWQRFETLLERHRIEGLANLALMDQKVVPAEVRAALARKAREYAAFDLMLAAETASLQRHFDNAGLPALFIKGATLGVLAYGGLGIKRSWDIDLLTTPESVEPALRLLEREGFRSISPAASTPASLPRFIRFFHEALLCNARGAPVELHWRLSDKPHVLHGVGARSAHQTVDVAGRQVRTLADELLVPYLIAHGQQHGWSRLKWLADLNTLLARRSMREIESAWSEAAELGLADGASAALLLCHQLFALQLPPEIAEQAHSASVGRLVRVDLACLVHPRGPTDLSEVSPTHLALMFSRFRAAKGWRQLSGELSAIWTQPQVRARFPAQLDFLYHLLRIPIFLVRLPLKLRMPRTDGTR